MLQTAWLIFHQNAELWLVWQSHRGNTRSFGKNSHWSPAMESPEQDIYPILFTCLSLITLINIVSFHLHAVMLLRSLRVQSNLSSQFVSKFHSFQEFNPLKPNSSNCYTFPYRPHLPFLISDVRALWRSGLSARVPERQKLKMVGEACMPLNTSKCNRMSDTGL